MTVPDRDPGIEHEPWRKGGGARPDPSEEAAERTFRRERAHPDPDREATQFSVYDEPAYRAAHPGPLPPGAPTYATWLAARRDRADPSRGRRIAFLIMLAGGPFAVLGAFLGGSGLLSVIVWGPVTEELMKVALLLTLLELRPHVLTSRLQIHLAAAGSGLGFSVIENLIYLHVYVPDPAAALVVWRWTVCVVLHVGCSLIASLGVARAWSRCLAELEPPRLGIALRWLVAAIALHGAYNLLATILSLTTFHF